MLSLSLFVLSLSFFANALSLPKTLRTTNVTSSAALGPTSQLNIVNAKIAPDGFTRSAVLVNGVYPAPLISVQKNNQLTLEVVNQLTDTTMDVETSIHWHGIFQQGGTNWADGVSWVTQCPIQPQKSFQYQFNVGSQTGTYWYHSHYSTQYCDGLRGPLVIYDPQDPLKYMYDVDDASTIITLSDWYHTSAVELGTIFGPVTASSSLINGLGRYSGGPTGPLAVINVQHGLRYRFRIVSMSCDPQFNFTIDGHRMTIIEADGNEVNPVQVDFLPILAGQRYSVVVTANQSVGNYWIRASPNGNSTNGGLNSAILRYQGAPAQDPTTTAGPYQLAFSETNLHPLTNPAAPGVPGVGKADKNIVLAPGLNASGYFMFNSVSFEEPSVPVLLQILSGATQASQLLPSGSIYELPANQVIELSFPDPTAALGGPHPIHLHGHSFSVVRSAGSTTYNYANPVRRDVVSIGNSATDNVTIRFTTDNPGPWFLHCHIDWHLHHGFAAVMAEATNQVATEHVPTDWSQLCSN
ncbi:laccase [Chiua virens]|nr:laccase [Chiua virens]KAG9309088.1 laccase [Chiua virens]